MIDNKLRLNIYNVLYNHILLYVFFQPPVTKITILSLTVTLTLLFPVHIICWLNFWVCCNTDITWTFHILISHGLLHSDITWTFTYWYHMDSLHTAITWTFHLLISNGQNFWDLLLTDIKWTVYIQISHGLFTLTVYIQISGLDCLYTDTTWTVYIGISHGLFT